MGRYRRFPTDRGSIKRATSMATREGVDLQIEERLGHLNPICAHCKKRNRRGAVQCERCGHVGEMRRSAKHPESTSPDDKGFRGKGHNSGRF